MMAFLAFIMKKRADKPIWLWPILAVAFFTAAPTFAQDAGNPRRGDLVRADRDKAFDDMVACYIKRNPADAVRYLRQLPGSSSEKKLYNRMIGPMNVCLGKFGSTIQQELMTDEVSPLYRRAIARQLVLANSDLLPQELSVGPDESPWFVKVAAGSKDFDIALLSVDEFANCVVRSDWVNARSLATTTTRSVEERKALNKLVPSFGGCVAAGQTVQLDREGLTLVIAEAVYHIGVGPTLEVRYPEKGKTQ